MINTTHRLSFEDKEFTLIGTAHISRESVELVGQVIENQRPDTVCVELCQSRYESITHRKRWQNTDLFKVIREKKAFLLLLNLMLAYFQRKIGEKFGARPGEEITRAIQAAETVGARLHLADRDIRITLSRTWRLMGIWTKAKLLAQVLTSVKKMDGLTDVDMEEIKRKGVLESVLSEIGEAFPDIKLTLIDERDQYMAYRIRRAPGRQIVAIVGAGHVPGIQKYWNIPVDTASLARIPPPRWVFRILKWAIPALIAVLITVGFLIAGKTTGTHILKWWVLANAALGGLGAAVALGHPLTVLSAIVASPLTSLNPMIAAGWVSGLVETLLGKPKVKDFENLPDDISSFRGFWKNRVTRILLVVVFTNIGSALGTFVAIPLMVRAFG